MNSSNYILITSSLVWFIEVVFLLIVLLRNKKLRNVRFIWVHISTLLWGFSQIGVYIFRTSIDIDLTFARLGYAASLLIIYSFFSFTYEINRKQGRILKITTPIALIMSFLITVTPLLVTTANYNGQYTTFEIRQWAQILFMLASIYLVIRIIMLLYKYFYLRSSANNERFAISLVMWGLLINVVIIIFTNVLVPAIYPGDIMIYPLLGYASSIVFIGISTYVFTRQTYYGFRFLFYKLFFVFICSIFLFGAAFFILNNMLQINSLLTIDMLIKIYIVSLIFTITAFILVPKIFKIGNTYIVNKGINIEEVELHLFEELSKVQNPREFTKVVRLHFSKLFSVNSIVFVSEKSIVCNPVNLDIEDNKIFEKVKLLHKDSQITKYGEIADSGIAELKNLNTQLIIHNHINGKYWGALLIQTKSIIFDEQIEFLNEWSIPITAAIARIMLIDKVNSLNENLQEQVDEQTQELQQKVLELQEARRKEADMIDIMGHELRTPMSVVKLNTDLLHNFEHNVPTKKEDFKKYVSRIKDAVETEIKLINTLLSSAKLEGDKIQIAPEKLDIDKQIKMSVHAQESRIKLKGLEIETQVDPNTPEVYADHARTVEILNNLIDNAVKYTHKGKITIKTEDDGNFVRTSITDTGEGLTPEDIEKLGTKFFRTSNYIKSEKSDNFDIVRPGGTGLGLYVSFNLIKKMGGEINVESELGKGSTFSFTLPKYTGQTSQSTSNTNDMFERLGLKKEKDFTGKIQE